MCGIAGFCDYNDDLSDEAVFWHALAKRMGNRLKHRGPNDSDTYVSSHAAFAHTRLAVVDIYGGKQPMTSVIDGLHYTIVYNGELYNTDELRNELTDLGYRFETKSDTEVLLKCYIEYGFDCPKKLNGIFAFAVDDERRSCCYMCRDRFGIKPLFYSIENERLVFASEIKALFEYPGINPIIDRQGLCEIFGLGPARTSGVGVFKDLSELKPGYFAVFDKNGFSSNQYYKLKSYKHPHSYEESVKNVKYLVEDAVTRQLISDVPLCTFLSGGLDSSIITSIASEKYKNKGKKLSTYSFDIAGNEKYFKPELDKTLVKNVVELCDTDHQYLQCNNINLADNLCHAAIAKDLPGMADIDSSLLYFCHLVKKNHVVALSGECADEIFGGHPWFHNKEAFEGHCFPWSPDLSVRTNLLIPEIAHELNIENYVNMRYEESIAEVPILEGENQEEKRRREISYLNIRWFMSTLLDRKDRTSMANGLEVRVPFADHRIVQYVFNIPWSYKCHNGIVKGLLRDAAKDRLPEDILMRQKIPYPKTHDPAYEIIVRQRLANVMADSEQPIHKFVSSRAVKELLKEKPGYGKPWFGQFMAGPQLMAYLLQINYWLRKYEIEIKL